MDIESGERILLTGAGLTHNFGTPLAKGMGEAIFNHKRVQEARKVRQLLLERCSCDFESAYHIAMNNLYNPMIPESLGPYSDDDRAAIQEAVDDAYRRVDAIVREYDITSGGPAAACHNRFQELITRFGLQQGAGFFFTLNQDLFIERYYHPGHYFRPDHRPNLPGFRQNEDWFSVRFAKRQLGEADYCALPTEAEVDEQKGAWLKQGRLLYLKLHGSQNWRDSEGHQRMVIGGGKEEKIGQEPLLTWYFEVFRNVLCQKNRRLLVIGYGFADSHINKVINEAAAHYGLKVYVMDPRPLEEFRASLLAPGYMGTKLECARLHCDAILEGLAGYFHGRLKDILSGEQRPTWIYRDVLECFFGETVPAFV